MLFLAHIKLVVHVLVCAHAITHIKRRRLSCMVKSKADAKIEKSRNDFHYSRNIICCKWYKRKPALLLPTNAHGMSVVSNIMRQTKASATKTTVSCPKGLFTYYVSTFFRFFTSLPPFCRHLSAKGTSPMCKHQFFINPPPPLSLILKKRKK